MKKKKKTHSRKKKATPGPSIKKIREIMGKERPQQPSPFMCQPAKEYNYDIATSTGPQYLNPDNGR